MVTILRKARAYRCNAAQFLNIEGGGDWDLQRLATLSDGRRAVGICASLLEGDETVLKDKPCFAWPNTARSLPSLTAGSGSRWIPSGNRSLLNNLMEQRKSAMDMKTFFPAGPAVPPVRCPLSGISPGRRQISIKKIEQLPTLNTRDAGN
jgi:hypothetical protein